MTTVRSRVEQACESVGRSIDEVTIVAVSKKQTNETIGRARDLGQRDFGENFAQELRSKAGALPDDIRWHYIGRLQRNKVKYVVGVCALIHSVDSVRLAEAISAKALALDIRQDVSLMVNLAKEDSKSGFLRQEVQRALEEMSELSGIRVCGLMTMPPLAKTPEDNRQWFRELRQLRDELQPRFPSLRGLSMGTSLDYPVAVEAGATHIRVGTAFLGPRLP